MVMDKLSNGEFVDIKDEWIDEAVNQFREALIKQLRIKEPFRLRASNVGRPICITKNEQLNTPTSRNDYNHIMRMMIGDAVEVITTMFIKASEVNITGSKTQVSYQVGNNIINGETDIEIDNKVYDIKSCSDYAYQHKWSQGWDGVYLQDSFGYVEQLHIYAGGNKKRMGGWIPINKSTGELMVVEATPTKEQLIEIEANIENSVRSINLPFRKQFKAEKEQFRKKDTGKHQVPTVCTFCNYMNSCWPGAYREKLTNSLAANPRMTWYIKDAD